MSEKTETIFAISDDVCTGCKACGDICPSKAISFYTNDEGFWYPRVDEEKCNHCGLCVNGCPVLHDNKTEDRAIPKVYEAWSKYSEVRRESTSGGVFWEIASAFLKSGGIVAGCRWAEDYRSAIHIIARKMDELHLLRGSKYIQSDTGGIYSKVKSEVQSGKRVLFCGTPCQNAAMLHFLNGNDENVYYFDFICRNVNSPLALQKYLEELEKKHDSKVNFVQQKNKRKGWQSLASYVTFQNGEESLLDRSEDYWINGFIRKDLYTRESCFSCPFRTIPRTVSNITVGDFWGIKGEADYDMFRGISVVFVNDKKGRELIELARENLILIEKTIDDVLPGNPALKENPDRNQSRRDEFFDALKDMDFSEAYRKVTGERIIPYAAEPDRAFREDEEKYRNTGKIDRLQYFYLNFICGNVIHKGKGRIIPFENTVMDLAPSSKIVIEGDLDFLIGTNVFRGSKAETLIRMGDNAYWMIRHGGYLFFGTTLDIKKNAVFDTGYFSANTGSVFVCAKRITFGEDVMIGRNVIIYDSDFHQIGDESRRVNGAKEVIIEDHAWLTGFININKGVRIGEGSIVANQTVINKSTPKYSLVAGRSNGEVIRDGTEWYRTAVEPFYGDINKKRWILFGYGIEGKKFYGKNKQYIDYVVDNYSKESLSTTFERFAAEYPDLDENLYLWVIASPNHYDEIFDQIRSKYIGITIVSYIDVLNTKA